MEHHQVDPAQILASLGITDVAAISLTKVGEFKTIWRVERSGVAYALQLFRSDQIEACESEIRAMEIAAGGGIPVPALSAQGTWQGQPVLLQTWCPGYPLTHALRIHVRRIWAIGVMFGGMHAKIHSVTLSESEPPLPCTWIEWGGPIATPIEERLRALAPRHDALLHLDYHLANVMTDGERITGVIDWSNARVGDPRADMARAVVQLRFSPRRSVPVVHSVARSILARAYLEGYQQVTGDARDLASFYAWAGSVESALVGHEPAKYGRSRFGLEMFYHRPLRRWTARWAREAGLS